MDRRLHLNITGGVVAGSVLVGFFPFNCCESGEALDQVSQRSCGASILGDTPNPTGHGPASQLQLTLL